MRATFLSCAAFLLVVQLCTAQQNIFSSGPITWGYAPPFTAVSTTGTINFPADYYGKWKILFSHPADFTPVCTSEIIALAGQQDEFKKLNTALIVISTDGLNSHIEWVKSMEAISIKGASPVKIKFPLVTDANLVISKKYGILQQDSSKTRDIRSVYIIDPENEIQAMFYYPRSVGRNIEEIKRTLIALQTHEKHDVLTPADWKPGDDVLVPSPKTIVDAEKLREKKNTDMYEAAWYMWYKKL
jgi:peroxiredoxin 2/4